MAQQKGLEATLAGVGQGIIDMTDALWALQGTANSTQVYFFIFRPFRHQFHCFRGMIVT